MPAPNAKWLLASLLLPTSLLAVTAPTFTHTRISTDKGGRTAIADVDGDGKNDVISCAWGTDRGNTADGTLKWYKYPNWTAATIGGSETFFGDEIIAKDFDGDGDIDVVASRKTPAAVIMYVNGGNGSSWTKKVVFTVNYGEDKGQHAGDFDKDGKLDIAWRITNRLHIAYQNTLDSWTVIDWAVDNRENLAVGDVDNDGDDDVVLNGFFYDNPGTRATSAWTRYNFASAFYGNTDTEANAIKIEVADVNGDGKNDIVTSPSEGKTGRGIEYYTSNNPKGGTSAWSVSIIDNDATEILTRKMHSLQVADLNNDGWKDVITGRIANPPIVYLATNASGTAWQKQTLTGGGSYSAVVGDIGSNGTLDIASCDSFDVANINVWQNSIVTDNNGGGGGGGVLDVDKWTARLIDANCGTAIFIEAHDVDGDGKKDLIARSYWYKNPGTLGGTWTRNTINTALRFCTAADFDNDGDIDVFGYQSTGTLMWCANNGSGTFTTYTNIANGGTGDFPQGILVATLQGGVRKVYISWHNSSTGVESVTIPANPTTGTWAWKTESTTTEGEDLEAGDMDGDGDLDLFLGRKWLRNDGTTWTAFTLRNNWGGGVPDRVELADVDKDGDLDALATMEAGTNVAWCTNPLPGGTITSEWALNVVGTSPGEGFSMDAADLDRDGDVDMVVGEHKGATNNNVYIFQNNGTLNWTRYTIDSRANTTMDHHDGTQFVDLDGDGDLDIITCPYTNDAIYVYENTAGSGTGGGTTNAAPVARAGADQTVTDTDNNGSESVTLNGSTSTDDGSITAYAWSWTGGGSATGAQPTVTLPVGTTTITLTVTDNGSPAKTATDTVVITVNAGGTTGGSPTVIDNKDAKFAYTGGWWETSLGGSNAGTVHTVGATAAGALATLTPGLAGTYDIEVFQPTWSRSSPSVSITVNHSGGATQATVNQTANAGNWVKVGTVSFTLTSTSTVVISGAAGQDSDPTEERTMVDAVRFTPVTTPEPTGPFVEAEAFDTGTSSASPWVSTSDATASGGAYMVIPEGGVATKTGGVPATGYLDYPFTMTSAGAVYIYLRLYETSASSNGSDSLYIDVTTDSGAPYEWATGFNTLNQWFWAQWTTGKPTTLPAGNHNLRIWYREDGFRVDRIAISPTPLTATDLP